MRTQTKVVLAVLPVVASILAGATIRELQARSTSPATPPILEATRTLYGDVLHQSEALALPTVIAVAGERLILADDFADRNLHVLRRSDGVLERSFGRKGRGPREFENILSIDVLDPSGAFMVHDPALQRVTWVDLDRDFDRDRWVADRSVKLNANAILLAMGWTRDGLVGVGTLVDARLAHLSPEGRLLRTSGVPPVEPGEVRRKVWTRAVQTRLKPRPDRTRWVVVSRFADRLELYDAAGALVAHGDRPYGFDPEDLREEDPAAVRFGYIDVATTASRIYALFSGRTRGQGGAHLGDRIHVFDWEGRLLDTWELDGRLTAIAVTPDDRRLYGLRHQPTPAVLTYAVD